MNKWAQNEKYKSVCVDIFLLDSPLWMRRHVMGFLAAIPCLWHKYHKNRIPITRVGHKDKNREGKGRKWDRGYISHWTAWIANGGNGLTAKKLNYNKIWFDLTWFIWNAQNKKIQNNLEAIVATESEGTVLSPNTRMSDVDYLASLKATVSLKENPAKKRLNVFTTQSIKISHKNIFKCHKYSEAKETLQNSEQINFQYH